VFVPIHDTNPLKRIRFQYVTVALIAINVAVYLMFESGWFATLNDEQMASLSVIPAKLLAASAGGGTMLANGVYMPERFTLITYMFMHGGWDHLLGNMLFLWVFGDNVEDAMGHLRFIMFYLMCGIFAALLFIWMNPTSDMPLVGASGAVAGVIGAYLVLHPNVKVWVLAAWRIPIRITAAWALGIWICWQLASILFKLQDNVAWWAHIGGLFAGATLILFMRRRGVVLFDRTRGGA
jgi:membrane associated rhomboid family serine protease